MRERGVRKKKNRPNGLPRSKSRDCRRRQWHHRELSFFLLLSLPPLVRPPPAFECAPQFDHALKFQLQGNMDEEDEDGWANASVFGRPGRHFRHARASAPAPPPEFFTVLRAFSYETVGLKERECGDKITLPHDVLAQLTLLRISFPYFFKVIFV